MWIRIPFVIDTRANKSKQRCPTLWYSVAGFVSQMLVMKDLPSDPTRGSSNDFPFNRPERTTFTHLILVGGKRELPELPMEDMYCPLRYFASAPGAAENIRFPLPAKKRISVEKKSYLR